MISDYSNKLNRSDSTRLVPIESTWRQINKIDARIAQLIRDEKIGRPDLLNKLGQLDGELDRIDQQSRQNQPYWSLELASPKIAQLFFHSSKRSSFSNSAHLPQKSDRGSAPFTDAFFQNAQDTRADQKKEPFATQHIDEFIRVTQRSGSGDKRAPNQNMDAFSHLMSRSNSKYLTLRQKKFLKHHHLADISSKEVEIFNNLIKTELTAEHYRIATLKGKIKQIDELFSAKGLKRSENQIYPSHKDRIYKTFRDRYSLSSTSILKMRGQRIRLIAADFLSLLMSVIKSVYLFGHRAKARIQYINALHAQDKSSFQNRLKKDSDNPLYRMKIAKVESARKAWLAADAKLIKNEFEQKLRFAGRASLLLKRRVLIGLRRLEKLESQLRAAKLEVKAGRAPIKKEQIADHLLQRDLRKEARTKIQYHDRVAHYAKLLQIVDQCQGMIDDKRSTPHSPINGDGLVDDAQINKPLADWADW